jgi:hypothetical protein
VNLLWDGCDVSWDLPPNAPGILFTLASWGLFFFFFFLKFQDELFIIT